MAVEGVAGARENSARGAAAVLTNSGALEEPVLCEGEVQRPR